MDDESFENKSSLELAEMMYGYREYEKYLPMIVEKMTEERAKGEDIDATLKTITLTMNYAGKLETGQNLTKEFVFNTLKPFWGEKVISDGDIKLLQLKKEPYQVGPIAQNDEIQEILAQRYYDNSSALSMMGDLCHVAYNQGYRYNHGEFVKPRYEFSVIEKKLAEDMKDYSLVAPNRRDIYPVPKHENLQEYLDGFLNATDSTIYYVEERGEIFGEKNRQAFFDLIKPYYGESAFVMRNLRRLIGDKGERRDEIAAMQLDKLLKQAGSIELLANVNLARNDKDLQLILGKAFEKVAEEVKQLSKPLENIDSNEIKTPTFNFRKLLGMRDREGNLPSEIPAPETDQEGKKISDFFKNMEKALKKRKDILGEGTQNLVEANVYTYQKIGNKKIYEAGVAVLDVIVRVKMDVSKKKEELKARLPKYKNEQIEFLEQNPMAGKSGPAYADEQADKIIKNKAVLDKLKSR